MSNEKKITLNFDLGQIANDVLVKCNLISKSIKDEALADIAASVQTPDSPETVSIINRSLTEAFGNVKSVCQRYLKTGRTLDNNMLEQMVSNVTYIIGQRQVVDSQGRPLYNAIVVVSEADTTVQVYKITYPVYDAIVSSSHVDVYTTDGGTTWKKVSDNTAVTPDTGTIPRLKEGEEKVIWKKESDNTTVTPKTSTTPQPIMEDYETDDIDTIDYETITIELFIPNFNVSVTDPLKSHIHKYVVDYIMGRFLQDQVPDKAGEYAGLADGDDKKNISKDLAARDQFTARKPSWI